MRTRRALGAAALALCAALPGLVAGPGVAAAEPVQPVTADDCKREVGSTQPGPNWAVQRLDAGRVAGITQGRSVTTGRPVRVAVLDSGLDLTHPQLHGVDAAPELDAIPHDPGRAFRDCAGHGTQVTALIAAQHSDTVPGFFGIAPQVRIIPIKLVNTANEEVQAANVARAIDLAIAAHAQIANLSLQIGNDPLVEAAVARARRAGLLLVAAAGNTNQQANRNALWPAKYSTDYDNVIAVGATKENDQIADFSDTGDYIDVVAPGDSVQTIGVNGGYRTQQGTSFATPYVTGTAALVLAANPGMTPSQIRDRLEATADPPGVSVPSSQYGYGIVNPYLAVTAVRTDAVAPTHPATPTPLRLGVAPPAPDRTLQHAALGAGFGLLGLAVLVLVGAAVLRGRRPAARG